MSGTSRPDKEKMKPTDPSANINLVVKSQDWRDVFFQIKRNTKLKALLTDYCDRRFLDLRTFRFLINGKLFPANKTPDELGLEDGDEIDAMMEQMGGG